ncbi:MAG: hypothetical protein A3F87_04780 [Omnitrophica WOR_2 bacterium RIFCSPLOWO2_12_FULL_51_24]|nr:MAG: hypothetical protein A2879_05265 [Omnitrophica WOR_2 bacterium RIFCSPHIGHO2_01_FULL_49_10]OGX33219.1 MAG: hypothetical protein A3I43_06410 [Omnitrophica WOR_2 bacterium RIFCSPLOWO2_02_FULL_50_19]OGX41856.1 MAG: hypothetical protein A3F87_04780 [Omnitrophica WOR_2 bacterium RIFCSPLOWO2_12_FULL_51_24]
MDREDPKNLLPEEEYLKQMSSLPKVKAPEDFLEKVHERIERRSAFEKIMRTLFVPVKVKVPLEVAAMAATIILIFSTIGIKKPVEREGGKREAEQVFADRGFISADLKSKAAASVPAAENKPIELTLKPYSTEILSKVKNQVELAQGKVTNIEADKETGMPQYVDAEIPAADYGKFVEKLASIGVLQEPILKELREVRNTVRIRLFIKKEEER